MFCLRLIYQCLIASLPCLYFITHFVGYTNCLHVEYIDRLFVKFDFRHKQMAGKLAYSIHPFSQSQCTTIFGKIIKQRSGRLLVSPFKLIGSICVQTSSFYIHSIRVNVKLCRLNGCYFTKPRHPQANRCTGGYTHCRTLA